METVPATPDPSDHQGPSDYEGWDPTPDPVGEIDVVEAAESGPATSPGIAFIPGDPATASGAPDANAMPAEDEEITALREKVAFYETFDSLIRDNIDRAGALLREVATKQVDAEAKLRSSTKDLERRQIEERTRYRKIFGSMLDEVSTIQQQVERLARQVSDALDDVELQLPAAGELSAIERGQAPGMTGLASASAPAGLPSGASSAAWVTHDDDLPSSTGRHATVPPQQAVPEPDPSSTSESGNAGPTEEPLVSDDVSIVEDAAGEVDPEVVEDVLTEGTDLDPAVADAADESSETVQPTDLSDLPEEFGLDNPGVPGAPAVVDQPYVEQAEVEASAMDDVDPLDDHLTAAGETEGFYVDATPQIDDLVGAATTGTPLQASAPSAVSEHDGGLDEEPAIDDGPAPSDVTDATGADVPRPDGPRAPYGSDAPSETGIGSEPPHTATVTGPAGGMGEAPSKLRRFEAEAPRPVWGSVSPAPRIDPPRVPAEASSGPGDGSLALDTIVLVHGVPRATTALSLKRYLEGLEAVSAVEPREYAEGVLRLQVTGDRAINIADLSAWPDGSGLQEIELREDLVEIRLPG